MPELRAMHFPKRGQQEGGSGQVFLSNCILLPSKREMHYSIPMLFMCSGEAFETSGSQE